MLSPHPIPFLQHFWVDINCEWMVTKVLSRKEEVKNPDKYLQKCLNVYIFVWLNSKVKGNNYPLFWTDNTCTLGLKIKSWSHQYSIGSNI